MVENSDLKYTKLPQKQVIMNESDLDNAIAQAEQFLVLARDLKAGFEAQKQAMTEARTKAIAEKMSEDEVCRKVNAAKWSNSMDGTRLTGAVKHSCVTLSFFLAKLRK